ncbi:hypothetical protein [Candidatus Palauibacter sp.]|uniref:hypothetical protein n=1 Tax=Candidatus Palauibacter sp. TaxID=3101350 RepID=UPI003AF29EFC
MRDLIGEPADTASERFGRAIADRRVGEDRWLRFEGSDWSVRLRARSERPGAPARIRSWTVAFLHGFDTVEGAMRAAGLPPPASRAGAGAGPLRLPLSDGAGRLHSLTASLRDGRIRSISGFDERPDWCDPGMDEPSGSARG